MLCSRCNKETDTLLHDYQCVQVVHTSVVDEVVDSRVQVYGDPVMTYTQIAQIWSGILGVDINPVDVPLCMIGLKLVRTKLAPDYSDSSDDIEGYLDIFRKIVGPDMVQARSVSEYLTKKGVHHE